MQFPSHPRIAVVGAGALGGYVGARLAHAGEDVHFLLRSDFDAVRERGFLTVHTAGEADFEVRPVQVRRETAAIGPVDVVLIALKTTQREALLELLPPLLGAETTLFSIQNGMGNAEWLAEKFPGQPIVLGMCHIGANREAPGILRNFSPKGGLIRLGEFGHLGHEPSERTVWLAEKIGASGIQRDTVANPEAAMWRKLMWNIPFNGLPVAMGGGTSEEVLDDPALREVARNLMEELRAASAARGFPIDPEFTDFLLGYTRKLGAYTPSTVFDLEAGRALEVEAIWGEPLRRGTAAGIPMPHLATLHALIAARNAKRGK
jgi:2-dehydropantoate 2-reductase